MKSKKIIAGAVTLLAAATLAACSGSAGKDIISMKGGTITSSEFYEEVKHNSAAQQVLLQMVINDVFDAKYGKEVSSKEVDEAYNDMAKQYGDQFDQALASAGLTKESYKEQIRTNKLVEYAVEEAAKKELTDENYKAAFEKYTPKVEARIIKLADEAKAKEILAKAQEQGADFAKLAQDNSADATAKDGGKVTFDSTSTEVPTEVQTAIFSLDEGQVGAALVPVVDMATYKADYYIVKLDSKTKKSDKWEDYKDVLKDSIVSTKQHDSEFITGVVSKALQDANVKVKDQAFQNVLSQYISTGEKSATTEAPTTEKSDK
ncbi:parvulin-like peptidyl-prolyl isomerase [Streptococcus varani]|uniref:Foldase protein PrsA n=1 Tax=Streptococcus varani TaxID=1608583 RepID=A0A0E3WF18_9STRE|nr:peptidylprolyl isomerase [Streptococcus varani]CQR24705.1 parvulin-like peptidyl-prolyl isomerase [Streptococcus varani]